MNRTNDPIETGEERLVARLIAAAGPPPPAPEIEIARIQEAARSEWRRRYAWRRRETLVLRWQIAAAAAAAVAALAFLFSPQGRDRGPVTSPVVVAQVERVAGEALVVEVPGGVARPLREGDRLVEGSQVKTSGAGGAAGRLALGWQGGRSLRLDVGSDLVLAAADQIELQRGAVYVDSRGGEVGGAPTIVTPRGRFEEVGTQFEVRLAGGEAADVRLRVREGAVVWRENGRTATAEAGVELALGADGSLLRDRIAPYGADWDWVLAAAPPPAIEGWPLARFLDWFSRESGLSVVYADRESSELARSVVVHGSVAQLEPREALSAVLASSGFEAREEYGALIAASSAVPQR